ncbi:MAG: hypothetical protein J6B07_01060 [Opitutales bacterium]|nr:hypothetical protein [Opitutales bacterium]
MKKIVQFLLIFLFSVSLNAVEELPNPDFLKQKNKFDNIKLFESKAIYRNTRANIELLKDYQKNPTSYKDSQLFPIAISYLSVRDFKKSREVLDKLSKAVPKNIVVWRTLGSACFLSGDLSSAVDAYKKAVSLGDEFSAIYCCSALTLANRPAEIKEFLSILKKFAPKNLEALNVLITYSFQFNSKENDKLVSDVMKDVDARKLLQSATPESMRLLLRVYTARPDIWTDNTVVVPGRAAALFEDWFKALDCYNKALKANPKNSLALRGMGLVHYRLGDVTAASNSIQKAYEYGDKEAAIDGIELFLLSKYRFIWNDFKDKVDISKLSLDIRAGLVQYASTQKDCADMFFNALKDKSSEPLFKDKKVGDLIRKCLDIYSKDTRAKEVATRLFKASK